MKVMERGVTYWNSEGDGKGSDLLERKDERVRNGSRGR